MTQTMKASEARQQYSRLLNQVFRKETRVVEKSGIPVAAIVATQYLERLDRYERERAARFEVVDQMRAAFQDVPDGELGAEITKAVVAARTGLREGRAAPPAR